MDGSRQAPEGQLSEWQGRDCAAPAMHGAKPVPGWALTLHLVSANRLFAVLGDGLWASQMAEAPWPPRTSEALPDAIAKALGRLGRVPLRLQLGTALDDWPWEREIALASPNVLPVPRYLTDLPEPVRPELKPAPLVVASSTASAHLALVQVSRLQERPLVLTDHLVPAPHRLALERGLRSHWRDPLLLSQALAQTLAQLGLRSDCCRLYGDGRAQFADSEQGWRPITVLSIDLVSSTQLLHSLGAEAYALRLQAYHLRCREVILRCQGLPEVPQGDGLMAFFGFPLAVEDAAARALTAAWQLSCGLVDLGMQVRIGVASGQIAVNAQQAYGPEVHLAARLGAAAQAGQILVAPSTRDRVGAGFVLEPCDGGLLELKDFESLQAVHELRGVRPLGSGKVPRPGGTSGFVGRRGELDRLREAWRAACDGRPQWCVVHGEAGIGKSRLMLELDRELRIQGVRCLDLTGLAQFTSSPFAAVVDALRCHLSIDPTFDAARLQEMLAGLLPQRRHDDDLGVLARLLLPSHPDGAFTTEQPRSSELLLDCLQALIDPGPTCLLIDDAHWLDPSSLELLRRLRTAQGSRALLVVVGERTE